MMKDREDNVWLVKDAMIKAGLTETLDGIFVANVLDMMKTEGLSSNWKTMEKLVPRARGSGMYVGPLIKTKERLIIEVIQYDPLTTFQENW